MNVSDFGVDCSTDLLDELFDGVYIVNRERKIIFWSRGAERISGYPRARMEGLLCHEGPLQHADASGCRFCEDGCPCPATRAMEEGIPIQDVVYMHHADGSLIPVETHIRPIRDASGTVTSAIEVFRDIRHWKKLETVSLEKDRLMGILAHDIRNPLTVIQTYAYLLKDHPDAKVREFIEPILRKTKLAWALVDDLLDAQAIEQGTVRLTIQDVALENVLRESMANYAGAAGEKEIQLTLEVATPGVQLFSDPLRLEEIFNNLISNAIHYSARETHVQLKVSADSENAEVMIRDHGVGISAEDLAKLFKPFGTTSNQTTGGEKSHGLGLYIVKKIMDLFAGTITVSSQPGHGTTFTLRFPYNGCVLDVGKRTSSVISG